MRGLSDDNYEITSNIFFMKIIGCDPTLELPQGSGFNEGSQHKFGWRITNNIIIISSQ